MESFKKEHSDFPDGAFFALAKEVHGWSVEEWAEFSRMQDFKSKQCPSCKTLERNGTMEIMTDNELRRAGLYDAKLRHGTKFYGCDECSHIQDENGNFVIVGADQRMRYTTRIK